MKYQLLILILLSNQIEIWCQNTVLNKVVIESDSITKMVHVQIKISGVKLDTLNRVKIIGNALATAKDSNKFFSDWFYSDDYLDNYDNKYTIVFDSIPNDVMRFEKVNGILRLFSPSEEKKSVLIIPEGKSTFDSNIIGGKSSNIKVIPINAIVLNKLKKRKKKFAEYIKETISKNHLNKSLFIETLNKYFNNRQQFKLPKNISENIVFYIEHSNFKVVTISINDSKNRDKQFLGSKLNGPESAIWEYRNFKRKLSSDFVIEVVYENQESIKDFEFELLNVCLK